MYVSLISACQKYADRKEGGERRVTYTKIVISGNFDLLSLGYLQLSKISARNICGFLK